MEKRIITFGDIEENYDESEPDEELLDLIDSVMVHYALEQFKKQCIYGVMVEKRGDKTVYLVNYNKYRSTDDIKKLEYLDMDERSKLAVEHEKLIYKVFHEKKPKSPECLYTEEDILEACYIGFTNALNNYNNTISVQFNCYAHHSMENACNDVIKGANRQKRAHRPLYLDDRNAWASDYREEQTLGDTISVDNQVSYLDSTFDPTTEYTKVNDDNTYGPLIEQLVEGLDYQKKMILFHHYGLFGYEHLTNLNIGKKFHMSKMSVAEAIKAVEEHLKQKVYELGISADILMN